MSDFDLIEYGYNIADETINFGTRNLADGDNLHEAATLATLKCSKTKTGVSSPHINAVIKNGSVYFNIHNSMKIFKDKECSEVVFNACFDAIIDTFVVRDDYFLVCLRNGTVHLIDCREQDYQVSGNISVVREFDKVDFPDRFFINSFLEDSGVLVVTKMGHVIRIKIQNEDRLEAEHVYDFSFTTTVASFHYPSLLVNGTKLAILDIRTKMVISDDWEWRFQNIYPLDYMFLALDFEGNLFRICAITLLVFPVRNSTLFKDFLVASDSDLKHHIIAITNSEPSHIQLLSYPEFSTIYSLKLTDEVLLITPESLNDELLYISKISDENGLNELRFRVVYETEPEQRLQRLLKKHKYEEAEKFAKLFNLDLAEISKAKVEAIVHTAICDSKDVDNLISLLDSIDDDEFKLQACLDVESSCLEDVRKILKYGCNLPLKKQNRQRAEELQTGIINLMFKFDTFSALYREDEGGMQSWLQFAACNMISELKSFLRNCQIEQAKIVYSRLDELTIKTLTEDQVADVLAILNNIPISTYEQFLPIFIPITLSILPSTLPVFVNWIYNKVFHLEKRSKADFPNNAIGFTENIVLLIRLDDVNDISFQRECTLHRESFNELSLLLSTLKRLKLLKDNYRITIPLSEYLAGPKNVIRILLNIEMCPEDFASLLKNFLSPFMLENHLEPNEIFLSEITDLMKYEEQYWINVVSSILNCISSVSVKLAAVKTILDTATVPWCATVRQIAHESLKYSHPLVSKIKELVENEPMQVVLRKPKYKLKEKRITDMDILKFVIGRVMRCRDENMIDDVYTLCKTQEEKHIANILLITRLIQDGRLEKAVELLNDNTPEERINCAKEIANTLTSVLNNEAKISDELRDNCYEIAGAVFQRLIDDAKTDFERTNHQETLNLLKNVRHLYKNFKIRSSTDSLKRCKDKIVEDILEQTRESFDAGKVTIEEVFSICHKLSRSLSLDEDEVLLKFCEKSGDYGFIFKAAARVSETEASSRSLCLMAVLLLKYLGTYKLQMLDDSSESESTFIFNNDNDENDVFYDGLRLANEIAAKAVYKATAEELEDCIEVAFWVNTSFYCLKSDNGDLRKKLFGDVYDVQTVVPGFLTFSCIRNTFDAYTRFIQIYNYPGSQYLTHFRAEAMTEDDLLRMVKQLPSTVENLCKEGQHFTSYKVVSILLNSLSHVPHLDEKILVYLHGVLRKHCVPKLLASILSNNVVNVDLLFSLLLFCEREDAVQFVMYSLRMYKRHPRKFASIIRTGLRFWKYHDLPSGQKEMMSSLVTLKWWKRFEKKKKFEYDHFFKATPDERFQLLINADCLDRNLIEEYSEDYELSVIVCYSSCLKRTILNWKPDYEVKTDIAGKRHLIVKNDEEGLLKKCEEIMKMLDREQILYIIQSLWVSVNKYYYEVLITILTILDEHDPKLDNGMRKSMLTFLKNYQRVSKPSEMETQNWYSNFPETRSLDPLSEFRLPFTEFLFTSSIWSIIRPEINLKTYKRWFDAIEILAPHLKQDDICSYVVKDVVSSGVLAKDAEEGWVLHSKHQDLFEEIEECVGHISDLERTASAVYHLLSHTPEGADQVIAATLCYKYAVEYKKSKPNSIDVETAFVKVQKKYYNCHAIHILHTYQLAEKKYINLVTHPGELILALYSDERILKKSESVELHCPDINKATEALAALFNMDIKHIRHTMIENWLFDCPSSGFDFDSSVVFSQTSTDESDNLKRAAYVCCTEDIQSWQMYLHRIGLGEEIDEHKSVSCRARALKLFALISSAETIKEMTESNYDEFTTFIDKLTLVSNLEYLGISLDVEAFDRYNKKELLNRLAQRAGNQLTIKTMAGICMTYLMYDLKYWEFILNSSVKYSMFVELKSYVCFLKEEKYHNKHFYINAWQKLIEHAFMSLSTVRNDRLNDVLVNNFLMIQSCPVLYSLKFDNLFKKCVDLGKVEFAAVLLQYVNSEKIVQFVRQRCDFKNLSEKLSNLSRKGIWGIHHVQAILAGRYQTAG